MIHNILLPLLIALSGPALGYLFSFLAAEEIRPGEKYFRWMKRILFVVFLGVLGYGLVRGERLMLLVVLAVVGLTILVMDFIDFTTKKNQPKSWWLASNALTYAFFVLAYLLLPSQQLLLASVIFLYGLPAGTMMRKG